MLNAFQQWFAELGTAKSPSSSGSGLSASPSQNISGFNGKRLAATVGAIAFLLPIVVWVMQGVAGLCHFDSISHHYFAPFSGEIFVGFLFAIGFLMMAYAGKTKAEAWLATFGGISAFVVAVFPTSGDGCEAAARSIRPFMNATSVKCNGRSECTAEGTATFAPFPQAEYIHFGAAGVLFVILAFFCIVIFARKDEEHYERSADGKPTPRLKEVKIERNRVYYFTGFVIVACILILALKEQILAAIESDLKDWDYWNGTFWVEAVALWMFAWSWSVRSRAAKEAVQVAKALISAKRAT